MIETIVSIVIAYGLGGAVGILTGWAIRSIRKEYLSSIPGPFITAATLPLFFVFVILWIEPESNMKFLPWPPTLISYVVLITTFIVFEVLVNHHTSIFGPIMKKKYKKKLCIK